MMGVLDSLLSSRPDGYFLLLEQLPRVLQEELRGAVEDIVEGASGELFIQLLQVHCSNGTVLTLPFLLFPFVHSVSAYFAA